MTGQHIVELLAGVASEVGAVGKNDRNEHQGFRFRGIDAVVNAVAKPLPGHWGVAGHAYQRANHRRP